MITLSEFLAAVKRNASRVTAYKLGGDGSGGKCDCVGLVIGALRLCGEKYSGTHGSNYFARNRTDGLKRVKAADLEPGMIVYKAHAPGEPGYDAAMIDSRYKKSGDLTDYYHIGVVQSVKPLMIAHCSSGGMHYDSRMGKWAYAGYCKGVDYMGTAEPTIAAGDKAIVDTPNNGTLNVRANPALNGQILLRIREGDAVEVVETKGEWARVRFDVGWVQTKFLKGGN